MLNKHVAELSPELAVCKRQAVIFVGAFCALFIFVTSLYCHFSAYFLADDYRGNLLDTLRCISTDWLGWAIISPILAHIAMQKDISTRAGRVAIVKLLVTATLLLGLGRMSLEYLLGRDTVAGTLIYFMPRYLFVTASLIGAGLFYVFKFKTELEIKQLKQQAKATDTASTPEQLVVYKGNCRALVTCDDIISITASGNYLELETHNGCYLMRNTMKSIESRLDSQCFVRIHRSHLVNLAQVESVSRTKLEAYLTNGKALRIGKKYLDALPHFSQDSCSAQVFNG